MSAAVQRRARALERERARIGTRTAAQPTKKSSRQLRAADHGGDTADEQAARALSALLEAREASSFPVVSFDAAGRPSGDSSGGAATAQQQQQQHGQAKAPSRHSKSSPLEGYLAAIKETDGGDDAALPPWFRKRWAAAIAAARSTENALGARLGRRPTLIELGEDDAGGAAMGNVQKLRELRLLILSGDGGDVDAAAPTGEDLYGEVLMAAGGGGEGGGRDSSSRASGAGACYGAGFSAAASTSTAEDHNAVGLFRGYSRELLRVRQLLTQAAAEAVRADATAALLHAQAGLPAAQAMLSSIAQRARADAAVLAPPALLPGVALDAEHDEEHARYLWLCERPERLMSLAEALAAAEAAATASAADVAAGSVALDALGTALNEGDEAAAADLLRAQQVSTGWRVRTASRAVPTSRHCPPGAI